MALPEQEQDSARRECDLQSANSIRDLLCPRLQLLVPSSPSCPAAFTGVSCDTMTTALANRLTGRPTSTVGMTGEIMLSGRAPIGGAKQKVLAAHGWSQGGHPAERNEGDLEDVVEQVREGPRSKWPRPWTTSSPARWSRAGPRQASELRFDLALRRRATSYRARGAREPSRCPAGT